MTLSYARILASEGHSAARIADLTAIAKRYARDFSRETMTTPLSPAYLTGFANGEQAGRSHAANFANGFTSTRYLPLNGDLSWMGGEDLGFHAGALSTGHARSIGPVPTLDVVLAD